MYGFSTILNDDFNAALDKVTDALKQEGFGVLTTIDVQSTMKAKLNIDGRPYTILGACNPPLAHKALETDPEIGLLLPCNVVVRENEQGNITVSFMDPTSVLGIVVNDDITTLASEVKSRLARVCNSLSVHD